VEENCQNIGVCPHCGKRLNDPIDEIPYKDILDHLNIVCRFVERGKKGFQHRSVAHRKHIKARWLEGHRLDDFRSVHEAQAAKWLDTRFEHCLRPSTLYRPANFESYLNHGASAPALAPESTLKAIEEIISLMKRSVSSPPAGMGGVIYRAGGWLPLKQRLRDDPSSEKEIRAALLVAWTA